MPSQRLQTMLEGCICGVTLRISVLFPALVIALLSWDRSPLVLLCLCASVLHELGHLLAMLLCRDHPQRITVGMFGVRIERAREHALGYRQSCLVSLSGPLMNLLCGTLLWCVAQPTAAVIHGGLALFNLLPVYSLDGGEALYAALCLRCGEARADRWVFVASVCVICPLAAVAFWLMIARGGNFTLLLMCAYLIFLLFLKEKH